MLQTDGEMDRQTTRNLTAALCVASRSNKNAVLWQRNRTMPL